MGFRQGLKQGLREGLGRPKKKRKKKKSSTGLSQAEVRKLKAYLRRQEATEAIY